MRTRALVRAGFVSRFVALVVDAWILTVGFASASYVISVALAFARLNVPPLRENWGVALASAGTATAVTVVYLTVCWSVFGRTPGKAIVGVRIVRQGGGELTAARALLRVLGYVVSAVPLYLGFAWVLVDGERRAWHDHIAGTQVVHVPRKYGRAVNV